MSSTRRRNGIIRGSGRVTRSQTSASTSNDTITIDTPPRSRSSIGRPLATARRARPRRLRSDHAVEPVVTPHQGDVQIVDLATPLNLERIQRVIVPAVGSSSGHSSHRPRPLRPLEVDLTCEHDLDDELVVVLEDIMAPFSGNRTIDSPLPIILGSNPPRARPQVVPAGNVETSVQQEGGKDFSMERNDNLNSQEQPNPRPSTSHAASTVTVEIQCPICLDSLSQIKRENRQMHSTTCGHLFCQSCITQAITQTKQCPTCRQVLSMRKIHPIFI